MPQRTPKRKHQACRTALMTRLTGHPAYHVKGAQQLQHCPLYYMHPSAPSGYGQHPAIQPPAVYVPANNHAQPVFGQRQSTSLSASLLLEAYSTGLDPEDNESHHRDTAVSKQPNPSKNHLEGTEVTKSCIQIPPFQPVYTTNQGRAVHKSKFRSRSFYKNFFPGQSASPSASNQSQQTQTSNPVSKRREPPKIHRRGTEVTKPYQEASPFQPIKTFNQRQASRKTNIGFRPSCSESLQPQSALSSASNQSQQTQTSNPDTMCAQHGDLVAVQKLDGTDQHLEVSLAVDLCKTTSTGAPPTLAASCQYNKPAHNKDVLQQNHTTLADASAEFSLPLPPLPLSLPPPPPPPLSPPPPPPSSPPPPLPVSSPSPPPPPSSPPEPQRLISTEPEVVDLTQSSCKSKRNAQSTPLVDHNSQQGVARHVLQDITNQNKLSVPSWLQNLQDNNKERAVTHFQFPCATISPSESCGSNLTSDTYQEIENDVPPVVKGHKQECMKPQLAGKVQKKRAAHIAKPAKQQPGPEEIHAVVALLNDRVAELNIEVEDLEHALQPQGSTNDNHMKSGKPAEIAAGPAVNSKGKEHEFLSYEEYLQAVKDGRLGLYRGTKFKSAEEKYAAGWAIRRVTHSWAKPNRKQTHWSAPEGNKESTVLALGEANPADDVEPGELTVTLQKEDKASLLKQELGKLQQQLAAIQLQVSQQSLRAVAATSSHTTEQASASRGNDGRPRQTRGFLAFDTNVYLDHLSSIKQWVNNARKDMDVHYRRLLVPKDVLRELDGLKRNVLKGKQAREATRMLEEIQRSDVYRGQREDERFFEPEPRSYHRGDDGILDCLLYFKSTGGEVELCSNDRNLRMRAKNHDIHAFPHELLASCKIGQP